jgi:hypothetical protein
MAGCDVDKRAHKCLTYYLIHICAVAHLCRVLGFEQMPFHHAQRKIGGPCLSGIHSDDYYERRHERRLVRLPLQDKQRCRVQQD